MVLGGKAIQKAIGAGMGDLPKQLEKLNEILGSMHAYLERIDVKLDKVTKELERIRKTEEVAEEFDTADN